LYWQRQQRFDLALESLQVARRIAPENPALQVEIARNLALQGDLAAALQAYQRAITQAPGELAYTRLLIDFCLRYDYELRSLALPTARRLVNLAPGDPANQDIMAQVLVELGDLVNAERFLWRALQADPDFAPARLHLGVIYLLQGNNQRAAQEFEQARALDPDSPAAEQAQRLLQNSYP
jgi:tetratricopeptide (TPR) repeat protein